MITVLHINSSNSWRGGEQQLAYLTENKMVNHIVFCKKNAALEKYCTDKKTDHYCFTNSINFIVEIKKIISEKKIDIIHLHDSNAHTKWYIFKQLTQNKIPVVLHRRVAFSKQKNYFSQKKYNDEYIKKVICISEQVKKETEKIITDKNKIIVVHSAIDTDLNIKEKTENSIPKIVTTAALTSEKNLFEFIDIAEKLLIKKNAQFYIFGEGKLKQELQHYINLKKLQNHIFLKGFVKNINRQLYQFDVFLFTSKSEGLGTSVLDAMLNKLPVVSGNFEAVNEIIKDSETGFVYKDVDDAVSIIEKLLTTHDLRLMITQNAFDFVQQFDISLMNEKIVEIYEQLITNNV